eukprot:2762693-Prymnesium_polylepis.1
MLLAPLTLTLAAVQDFPPAYFADVAQPRAAKTLLSSTLGSNMVLQRAPQQAVVWGFAAAGTTVKTTMDAKVTLTTTADAEGIWRQKLPATPASVVPHTFAFASSSGETAGIKN